MLEEIDTDRQRQTQTGRHRQADTQTCKLRPLGSTRVISWAPLLVSDEFSGLTRTITRTRSSRDGVALNEEVQGVRDYAMYMADSDCQPTYTGGGAATAMGP